MAEVAKERDLNIAVSNNLKPSLCARAAQKAMQVWGIIKRNFCMNSKEDFRLLFNGYVRPHMEYCVQMWSPYLKKDINCVEKVQRMATKLVTKRTVLYDLWREDKGSGNNFIGEKK